MVKFKAIGVSEGLAKAKALVIKEEDLSVIKETVADVEAECKRVLDAVEKAKQQIEVLRDDAEKNIGAAEAEIFDAHLMMLDDPDFVEGMTNIVTDEKVCAEYACFVNCENFQAMFRALDDEYMQARAADIGDISQRVIKNLKGIADNAIDTITEPCIIVANDLTPSDTAKIGRQAGCRFYHEDRRPHEPFGDHGAFDGYSGDCRCRREGGRDRGRRPAADRRRGR